MPVIVQNYCMNTSFGGNEDSFLVNAKTNPPLPSLSLCELLYPAFNTIVPQLYENALPHLEKVKSQADVDTIVGLLHSIIGFAFKTQIFDKMIW